jgi:hypothetical protein
MRAADVVGLQVQLSSAFHDFFSSFRWAIGGRYRDLAHDLTWGVLLSGTTVLAEIARALRADPAPPLHVLEKRLSAGLKTPGWDDAALADALTRHNARGLEPRGVLIADLTDLAKPSARRMEGLATVHDGSQHRTVPGFPVVATFRERAPHDLVVLQLVPFSMVQQLSQNQVVLSVLRRLKRLLPNGRSGLTLEDRGFDGDRFFEFFVAEEWPFIIRLRGDRHLTGPWGRARAEVLGERALAAAPWQGSERTIRLSAGLPDVPGRFALVGYEHRGHLRPLWLLAYEPRGEYPESALAYARCYLRRWGGEDWTRLLKQSLGLEAFRVRSAAARRRLCLAAQLALTFAGELERRGGRWVEQLKASAASFEEPVASEVSRLLRGIQEVGRMKHLAA